MKAPIVAAVAAFISVAAAWGDDQTYTVPGNSNNECTDQQKSGVDFSGATSGSLNSYQGVNFSPGWECGSSFGSKRKRSFFDTGLFRRGGGGGGGRGGGGSPGGGRGGGGGSPGGMGGSGGSPGKSSSSPAGSSPGGSTGGSFGGKNCAMADSAKSPSMSSDKDMTIGEMHVQPERDTCLEFHYNKPGQSAPCKETASIPAGGGVHKPSICAQYNQVSVVLPSASKAAHGSCSVAIHSMSYICTTQSTTSQTTSSSSTSTSSISTETTQTTPTTTPATTPVTTPTTSTQSTETTETTATTGTTETSGVTTTTTPTSSFSTMYTQNSTSPVTTTSMSTVPTSTAPVTTSTTPTTSMASSTPETSAPVTTTPSTVVTPTMTSPVSTPTGSCPAVVPQCLSTFLFIPKCSSNADTACMCPSGEFVELVMACINSYGGSEVHIAVAYFQGLCASAIPTVPAYTSCPSFYNSVAGISTPPTLPSGMPMTSVPMTQVTTMPATYSTGPQSGSPIPSSTITSTLITNQPVPAVTLAGSGPSQSLLPASNANAAATSSPPCSGATCPCETCAATPTPSGGSGYSQNPSDTLAASNMPSTGALQAAADRPQVAMAGSVAMAIFVALFGI